MGWHELTVAVRVYVEETLGASLVSNDPCTGGFSAGTADVMTTTDGTRGFVKAIGTEPNPVTPSCFEPSTQG